MFDCFECLKQVVKEHNGHFLFLLLKNKPSYVTRDYLREYDRHCRLENSF